MLLFILTVYITIGVVSALSNLGKWVFSSMLLAIPFLPFMIIYYLLFGDSKKRSEAFSLIITLLALFIIIYSVVISIQSLIN